jgi:hypothetical protein
VRRVPLSVPSARGKFNVGAAWARPCVQSPLRRKA